MKRAIATGVALLTAVGFAASTAAQAPASGHARFTQRPIPKEFDLSNLPSQADPNKVVSAVVMLSADSVSGKKVQADQAGAAFDRKAAERQVRASQASVLPALRAAGAKVGTSTYTVLNAVTVRATVKDLRAIASIAGVSGVHVSRPITRDNAHSNAYTGVPQVWQALGLTGKGMTVGIIDDGIDYYHADFGGTDGAAKYAADDPTIIEPGTFPTAKVVGGYDFVGDAYDADPGPGETDVPAPDADPLACGEHGTHVSGTAAGAGVLADGTAFTGPYNATTLTDHSFSVAPGSAPEASIRMYKVFGCDGSVNDDIILAAIDKAVADGVSVLSMSLGSTWGTGTGVEELALDNATKLGVLSVVAAGNSGPSAYLVGSPSTASSVLSVAAADTSEATLPEVAITGDLALSGQNSNLFEFAGGPVSGTTVDVGLGCDAADYDGLAGMIAVTHRGDCDRVDRAILGSAAGVAAVIFVNNADGFPPVEGAIPGATVPFVGVPKSVNIANGTNLTLAAGADIPNPAYTNFASFTSNGLRLDNAPKPDITAPGVNILSAFAGSGDQGVPLSGTSMATPHTSGIALLVRQAHPTWGPIAVKGALMSTADPSRVGDWNVVRGGVGMVTAPAAVDAVTYLSTANGANHLAFGFKDITENYEASRTITLTNTSSKAVTYDLATELDSLGLTRFSATVNPSSTKVNARSSKVITVTLKIRDPQNLPEASFNTAGTQLSINGLLVATPRGTTAGVHTLRAPLVLVPYGASDIRARAKATAGTTSSIALANRGVHTGTVDTYQWIATDDAGDTTSPLVPDVRDVGVQQFDIGGEDLLVFAISSNNRVTSAATAEYDVFIDTNNDGDPDFWILAADFGLVAFGDPTGDIAAFTIDLATFDIVDVESVFAPNNGSVVAVPVLASVLGATGPMGVSVSTNTVMELAMSDDVATGYYDPTRPAVSNGDFFALDPLASANLPTSVDAEAAAQQGALGWLVVSVDDAAGSREADRVPLHPVRD